MKSMLGLICTDAFIFVLPSTKFIVSLNKLIRFMPSFKGHLCQVSRDRGNLLLSEMLKKAFSIHI